jgi:peroxiredoxin
MGTPMPPFQLSDPHGKSYQSDDLFGTRGLLVIFTCHRCPYAKAAWLRLIRLANHAKGLNINTVAINPNIHHAEDGSQEMIKKIKELKIDFPYLMDTVQSTAKNFQAQCTPDIFLYDHDKKLVYHGRIDDNWEDETKVTTSNLKLAIDALATGNPVERRQISSIGCSIEWRTS